MSPEASAHPLLRCHPPLTSPSVHLQILPTGIFDISRIHSYLPKTADLLPVFFLFQRIPTMHSMQHPGLKTPSPLPETGLPFPALCGTTLAPLFFLSTLHTYILPYPFSYIIHYSLIISICTTLHCILLKPFSFLLYNTTLQLFLWIDNVTQILENTTFSDS